MASRAGSPFPCHRKPPSRCRDAGSKEWSEDGVPLHRDGAVSAAAVGFSEAEVDRPCRLNELDLRRLHGWGWAVNFVNGDMITMAMKAR